MIDWAKHIMLLVLFCERNKSMKKKAQRRKKTASPIGFQLLVFSQDTGETSSILLGNTLFGWLSSLWTKCETLANKHAAYLSIQTERVWEQRAWLCHKLWCRCPGPSLKLISKIKLCFCSCWPRLSFPRLRFSFCSLSLLVLWWVLELFSKIYKDSF